MQVFQRGINESLVIGDDVVITVLEISPTCVRLGIIDPAHIPEYREETLHLQEACETADSSFELALP